MGEVIVFTSGKGGVGKTTCLANIGAELSLLDKKVIMVDADMGLRNLDVVMGLENQIFYNLKDLFEQKCRLQQTLVRDKRYPNLYVIPASEEPISFSAYESHMSKLIHALRQECDYLFIDCPAGIDQGFHFAVSAVDRAILVTTPHISAIRDASKVAALLGANRFLQIDLLINQADIRPIRRKDMISPEDIEELLDLKAIGIIPEDPKIIVSQNCGMPVGKLRARSARYFRMAARHILAARIIPLDLSEEKPPVPAPVNRRKGVFYEIS